VLRPGRLTFDKRKNAPITVDIIKIFLLHSVNLENLTMWVTLAEMNIIVSETQAHFETTRYLSTICTDLKKNCCMSKNLFFKKKHIFLSQTWKAGKMAEAKMAIFLMQVKPRLTISMNHLRQLSLSYQRIPSCEAVTSLLVQNNTRLF